MDPTACSYPIQFHRYDRECDLSNWGAPTHFAEATLNFETRTSSDLVDLVGKCIEDLKPVYVVCDTDDDDQSVYNVIFHFSITGTKVLSEHSVDLSLEIRFLTSDFVELIRDRSSFKDYNDFDAQGSATTWYIESVLRKIFRLYFEQTKMKGADIIAVDCLFNQNFSK